LFDGIVSFLAAAPKRDNWNKTYAFMEVTLPTSEGYSSGGNGTTLVPLPSPALVSSLLDPSLESSLPAESRRFVGRQPIVDSHDCLYGYELLFRQEDGETSPRDPEAATRRIVDYWSMLVPDHGRGLAFVNCTRAALVDGIVTLLPARNTVLEILEDIDPDPPVIESCRALRRLGYRFALDDFSPRPSRATLIELADFIKIDFLASDPQARREIYAMASGRSVRFLAEKIETGEERRAALAEGCSLFQGYFFSRPVTLASRVVPQNRLVYLRLLAALQRSPADICEIERLVMSDASLCYRVLRLANSALYGLTSEITSVRGALLMVGDEAVRRMVSVAIASALAGSTATPILAMALARARFCEALAPSIGAAPAELYLLGMLSLLDVLLATPIDRILEALPLTPEMKAALSGKPCPWLRILELVRCLESCEWKKCEGLLPFAGLSESDVSAFYLESVQWASAILQV
jgi:c-di-GMP-related signal transduction protein